MNRNIQEYVNGLVNKERIFYLDLNNNSPKVENHNCQSCNQKLQGKLYCQNCNSRQLEGEITDLKEFASLKGINASNNQITNLNFLETLPNKDKLKGVNLFGNQIKEIDFAELFTNFPNLEKVNLQGNPLSAKNLSNLSSEQFGKLVNGIKENKIRINSYKGTILMDLLEHAQKLANQGKPEYNAHLQTLTQINQTNQPNQDQKAGNSSTPLLVSGLVFLGVAMLVIGYYLGKKRKDQELD